MRAKGVALIPECAECERPWLPADVERWRAYLTDDEPPELAFYCPEVPSGSPERTEPQASFASVAELLRPRDRGIATTVEGGSATAQKKEQALRQSAGHRVSGGFIRHRILVVCTVGLALVLAVAARSARGSASPLVAGKSSLASEGPVGRVAHYWVDKGKRIVFEATNNACSHRELNCLWVMDANGQHKRRLAPDAELASVSPSGRLLARFDERRSRLIITTLAGKRARSFTFRASLELPRLAWARDDSAVAFEGQAVRDRIYVAERRKGVRVIAQGPFLYGPAWSPDSRLLAFRRCPEAPPSYWRPRWPGCDLMVARRDGSHARLVARHTDTDDLWAGRFDAPLPDPWSPNGRWLVFTRKFQIYVIHPDGSGLRRVRGTSNIPRRLAWSPDNKRLAYIAGGIFVIPVQGGREERITSKTSQDTLSWAPSERILYSRRGVIWTAVPGQPPVAIK